MQQHSRQNLSRQHNSQRGHEHTRQHLTIHDALQSAYKTGYITRTVRRIESTDVGSPINHPGNRTQASHVGKYYRLRINGDWRFSVVDIVNYHQLTRREKRWAQITRRNLTTN